jgi:hypothetical protein
VFAGEWTLTPLKRAEDLSRIEDLSFRLSKLQPQDSAVLSRAEVFKFSVPVKIEETLYDRFGTPFCLQNTPTNENVNCVTTYTPSQSPQVAISCVSLLAGMHVCVCGACVLVCLKSYPSCLLFLVEQMQFTKGEK